MRGRLASRNVPADSSLVSAFVTALDDPNEDVQVKVSSSLIEILFESPVVGPALFGAPRNNTQRNAVADALDRHLQTTNVAADSSRVRPATIGGVIRVLSEALALEDAQDQACCLSSPPQNHLLFPA